MNISKSQTIPALISISIASGSALAGGWHSYSGAGAGQGFDAEYRAAVFTVSGVDNGMRAMKVGYGMDEEWGYQKTKHHGAKAMSSQPDIVDTAAGAGSFDTLVIAIKAAGLEGTLKGDGPFTVFAPSDEAFAKIPPDQLTALLEDKAALTKVLTYHVVAGRVTAEDVVKLTSAESVQGQSIRIDASNGVMVDNARVVITDIEASNGVIHVIDTVIMPN